jgi:hypothetical protein
MATKVDELIVEIKAETAKLKRGLKDVNNQLDKTSKKSSVATSKLKAIGGAAVIAAFAKLGSTIARVGSGFEDLQDSLNVVFGGMQQGQAAMDRVMTFAQTTPFQIEDATKAFIALKSAGIEPSMDMLQTFADTSSVAVDQLGTFEALVRLTQRSASGGMGLEELNMISDRGIDVLGILKERLGLTKDDIAEFGKTAEGAAEMVKALTDGLNEKFGGAMEQKMDNLSTKTSNMVIAFKQLGDDVFKSGLGDFLKSMADDLTSLAMAIGGVVRSVGGIKTLSDMGVTEMNPEKRRAQMVNAIREQQKVVEDLMSKHGGVAGLAEMADKGTRVVRGELEGGNVGDLEVLKITARNMSVLNLALASLDEMMNKVDDTVNGEDGLDSKFINFGATFKKLASDSKDAGKVIAEQLGTLEEIASSKELQEFFDTSPEEIARIQTHLEGLAKEAANTGLVLSEELEQSITNLSMSFTKDFVDSLMAGENALESFKDFSKQIVSTIISTFLQLKVIQPLMAMIFSGSGGGTATLPANNLAFDSMMQTRAGGGTVQARRPVLVGERGAEIFVPNTSGSIMNHADSKGVGGGGLVVNQQISFSTGVVPTVRAEVSKMLPQIADVTKFAVLEAAQRGGSFRKGLQGA